ncbi:hypothetical protein E2C01_078972 [Portunus trituberculatus]|uniref:Uncharacterized protein n=1 Tax=Portunus trituberculatus TaxID=210409 RepID=A0A5B7IK90_PORTR|nr:hypothetical protein [Portunus trituberculatus]
MVPPFRFPPAAASLFLPLSSQGASLPLLGLQGKAKEVFIRAPLHPCPSPTLPASQVTRP